MSSEARPRQRRLVNPEHLDAILRRIVAAWHQQDDAALDAAVADAARLIGVAPLQAQPVVVALAGALQRLDPPPTSSRFDEALSAQPCGCDDGAGHRCEQHR